MENLGNLFLLLHQVFFFLLVLGLAAGLYFLFITEKLNWHIITNIANFTAMIYLISFSFGQLLYPLFFPELRTAVYEGNINQALGLFEVKDHLTTLGVFIALGLLLFGVFGRMQSASMLRRQVFGSMYATLGLITTTSIIVAFILNSY